MHKVKIIKQMYADVQHVCMIKKKSLDNRNKTLKFIQLTKCATTHNGAT